MAQKKIENFKNKDDVKKYPSGSANVGRKLFTIENLMGDVIYHGFGASFKDVVEQAVKEDVNFTNANFMKKDLSGANLKGAFFYKAHFDGAKLDGANLENANFDDTNLNLASIKKANLKNSVFYFSSLSSTNFEGSDLTGSRIEGINAVNTKFSGADLNKAVFRNINLEQTKFILSDIRDTKFELVQTNNKTFENAISKEEDITKVNPLLFALIDSSFGIPPKIEKILSSPKGLKNSWEKLEDKYHTAANEKKYKKMLQNAISKTISVNRVKEN